MNTGTKEISAEELDNLIKQSASRKLTPEEKRAQRISYVMSIAGKFDDDTRREVEKIIDDEL